jgi:riboflavin transporter
MSDTTPRGGSIARYTISFLRYFFGTHALVSGLNYFLQILPDRIPADPRGHAFVSAMIATGLFSVIKVVEVIVGLGLLTGRFVPLLLIAELPISITICGLALQAPTSRSIISGPRELLLNLVLMLAYGQYYLPLLRSFCAEMGPLWRVPPREWFSVSSHP